MDGPQSIKIGLRSGYTFLVEEWNPHCLPPFYTVILWKLLFEYLKGTRGGPRPHQRAQPHRGRNPQCLPFILYMYTPLHKKNLNQVVHYAELIFLNSHEANSSKISFHVLLLQTFQLLKNTKYWEDIHFGCQASAVSTGSWHPKWTSSQYFVFFNNWNVCKYINFKWLSCNIN